MIRPDGPRPLITVSIVVHGQWELARQLLEQLQQHCRGAIDQVLLTVNLPEPGIDVEGWALPIRRIDNRVPQGFGRNHNAAFSHCRTPWFLVLNPDIRLEGDVLGDLVRRAGQRTGLLTPRVQEPGKCQPEPYRALLTPAELLRRRHKGHQPPGRPAWVAGMFMLLRYEAFAQVSGFDERYFMYCEDFDLCARLRLAGWSIEVAEDQRVLHEAQRASNSALRPFAWHVSSLLRVWLSPVFWRYAKLLARE
jgi:N-acetylglucosaminyl-diphospho-decaprenol L-rhamnosyltransferase